ncbi:MAG: TonB-dependent receptor [Pseudomonadota bacterium]
MKSVIGKRCRISTTVFAMTLLGVIWFPAASAQEPTFLQKVITVDIPAGTLQDGIRSIADDFGLSIAAPEDLVTGKRISAITGSLSVRQAITRVLRGTGLTYEVAGKAAIVIKPNSQLPMKQDAIVPNAAEQESSVETILVTGTNIKGLTPESTPVTIIDRQQIQASGQATVRDFFRMLPQNFGGGADEGFAFNLPTDESAGLDFSEGTGINLRGLGAGSTLTLLNGRRIAPSSNVGAFADISMIPASAIERIELLSDGASAIYGSDAVAGVANLILRKDFDGLEVSGRYGQATEGGPEEYRANVTAGKSWESGNGLLTYEYYERGNLDVSERDFLADVSAPRNILPTQKRHSILASASQSIGANISLSGDILFSERDTQRVTQNTNGSLRIDLSDNESLSVGGEMDWQISDDYSLRAVGTYSTLDTEAGVERPEGPSRFQSAETAAVDAILNGSIVDLPGGRMRFAFGGQYRNEQFTNLDGIDRRPFADGDRDVYAVFGELFLPVIDKAMQIPGFRRLEFNLSGRFEDYSDFGSSTDPKFGVLYSPIENLRLRGTYSTSFRPPALGRTGAADTEGFFLSTALLNLVTGDPAPDPSVADVPALILTGTGTGLGAETSENLTLGFDFDMSWGNNEISVSSTFFDITFDDRINIPPIPGGGNPNTIVNAFVRNPEGFVPGTVIRNPSQAQVESALNRLNFPLESFLPGVSVDQTQFIADGTTVNVSETVVRGVDFTLQNRMPWRNGELTFGIDGTWLLDYTQQAGPGFPAVDSLDTLYNPLDLRIRAQFGYQSESLSIYTFLNFSDDYALDSTGQSERIGSFTTVDLTLAYQFNAASNRGLLEGTTIRLLAQNLFNEEPPAVPIASSAISTPFDPANASAMQRFIAIELSKAF